jgi:glutathione synthase/RimK-type ligase-like ATP-grasp enzyme
MLVGILKLNSPLFLKKSNNNYKKILDYNSIPYLELSLDDPDFWEKLRDIDLFIFRWAQPDDHHQIAETLLPIIENSYGIKCFPDQNTCWHYDDKIKEYYLLTSKGYPFIKSWIFWEKENALKFAAETKYPIIFKLKNGAGSTNVFLIKDENSAVKAINKMFGKGIPANSNPLKGKVKYKDFEKLLRAKIDKYFLNRIRGIESQMWQLSKNYILFQKYLPNNDFDTRITTIGNLAFGFRRFTRENDFRASGSGKIDYDIKKIDLQLVELALKISKELNFQTMAYDFLYNENEEPEICEISYTYADKVIFDCPGYWDENLNWNEGHFWPEFLHLKDLLNLEELKPFEVI